MRIMRPTFCCLTLAACWSILALDASAQLQSAAGQQSGSGRGGGSSSGGSSMFSSGSSGGRSGAGGTSSGFGSGSGTRNGQGGLGGMNSALGGAGSNQNGGFIGRNQDMSNFIGRTAQGQAAGGGQGGNQGRAGGGGNRSLDSGLLNLLNGGQGGGNAATQQPAIRPRLKAAFDFPARPTGEVIAVSQGRFTEFAARYPKLDAVQMTVGAEGTVVLSGAVPSRDLAKLAESLMRLEPGVRKVENNLSYPQPEPAAE